MFEQCMIVLGLLLRLFGLGGGSIIDIAEWARACTWLAH